jgi:hypothetical protein
MRRHNPFYAWRTIWNANNLLKVGLVWRVGNMNSIKILGDKWLHSPVSYVVQSLVGILDRDAEVSELIDEDSN